jgi:glycosyltransferase involved in cell wall biosynthesis
MPLAHENNALRERQKQCQLDLVIPALNEEARIESTLAAICGWSEKAALDIRVIVVDNGSADATTERVDYVQASYRRIEVVSCRTRGKGAAVRAGVLRTTADCVGYCDADLSTPVEAIGQGLELIRQGWDLVLGSRYCKGAQLAVEQPWLRQVGSWAFRRAVQSYVGSVADTQCGFKLFSGEVARSLFRTVALTGFAFDVEIVARGLKQGYRVVEMPVTWSDRAGSTFRPVKDGLSSFREVATLRRTMAVPS